MQKFDEKLIFGSLMEDVEDIISINEISPVTAEVHAKVANKEAFDAKKKFKIGQATALDVYNAELNSRNIKRAVEKEKEIQIKNGNEKDPVSGEKPLREEDARIESLKRQKNSLTQQINRAEDANAKKLDNLRDRKEKVQATISNIKSSSSSGTAASSDANNDLLESADIKKNRYSDLLFNGLAGDAIKYFVYGEINNKNMNEIEIAKTINNDKEVRFIVKKILEIINRAEKDKSRPNDYDELKSHKLRLRMLYKQAKNKYNKK